MSAILLGLLMVMMPLAGCVSDGTDGLQGPEGPEGPPGTDGTDGSSLHLVVAESDLPECNGDLQGQIYFVSSNGAFQVCSTMGWSVVDLTGPAGTDGTNGTDVGTVITTQGDILYRDGSGLQRLAKGTATQILQINAGATAPEWTAKPEGKIVKMQYYENTTEYSNTSSSNYVTATNHGITFTPSATNNILYIQFMPNVRQNSGGSDVAFKYRITRTIGGSSSTFYEAMSQETYYYDSSGGQRLQFPRHFLHRDNDHNTTSAITYTVDFRNVHSGQGVYISNDNAYSRWLITEIKP